MPHETKETVTVKELLAYSEDAMVKFMNQSHTKGHRFDISRITDFDGLSPSGLDELSQKLENAAKNLNPLEADKLRELLDALQVAQQFEADDKDAPRPQDSHDRSRTASPPPPQDAARREALAHDKLILAGGWPVILKSDLRPIAKMTKRALQMAALFVDLPKNPPKDYIIPLFTSQLDHWNSFKQQWQWCNRGKVAAKKGFAEFLESMKEEYLATGGQEVVENTTSFVGMARRKWEHEQVVMEASNGPGFKAYARAAETRLASHGFSFSQPFKLSADPQKQDEWTTRVEYLNFVYWQEDGDTAAMENAEARYRHAMEEPLQLGEEKLDPFAKRGTPQQQLNAVKEEWTRQWGRINKISQDSAPYLKYQALLRRHRFRAQWILEEPSSPEKMDPGTNASDIQDSKMENASEMAPDSIANSRQLRRRKARHDEDDDHKTDGIEALSSPIKRSRTQARESTTRHPASISTSAGRLDRQDGGTKTVTREQPAGTGVPRVRQIRGKGRSTRK